ncbi:MAG: DUF2800 domain-containing protein, partial [Patescibacteria group bacterium]|nr:DUF2800 domain-containing protein [Patescibacteria group bacterium]
MIAHSPLGASSAERWLHCPGSVTLAKKIVLPDAEESEYAKEGTAAHEAAAFCLKHDFDSWEVIGQDFGGIVCTREMAEALQTYISHVRMLMAQHWMIEARIGGDPNTRPHKDFYGTVDFAAYTDRRNEPLHVADYKHGVGISVDAEQNPQLMYYAYGILHT